MIYFGLMGDFETELSGAVSNRGKDDIADAIGMPDQHDYEVLVRIMNQYEKRRPGFLAAHMAAVREEFTNGTYGRNLTWRGQAEVNKDSRMRLALDIPADLGAAIEKIFPSMFRSKQHLRWFCKKFPGLTIAGKPL